MVPAGVAQLVRARGSYPRSPGFKSLHRHHFFASLRSSTFSIEMDLHERVLRAIRRHADGATVRVLVALSGGRDSVAMLHLLRDLEQQGHVTIAGAAHLNHMLRG